MTLLTLIAVTLAGSIISLLGGIFLLNKKISREKILLYAMPFGAGALLGAAFLNVLPEALHLMQPPAIVQETHHEQEQDHAIGRDEEAATHVKEPKESEHDHNENIGALSDIMAWTLAGFVLFFVLERSIRWFHRHHEHAEETSHKSLIVVGDTIHNAIDGVAIGAAFLVNIPLGIATAIAVAAHELPQEIGDFGLLLAKGMARKKVLIINVMSSLATVVTALITFSLGGAIEAAVPLLLALVAGCFIYIAAADIIPDIHEQPHSRANIQSALLLVGIVVIPFVAAVMNTFGLTHAH